MALVKNTNSYVDVAEADAFFGTRLDVAAWSAADNASKEAALVTATAMLDDLAWVGVIADESQTLAFPRVGSYNDPKMGYVVYLEGTEIPERITRATFELGYHLLNNDGLLDETGSVDNITVGNIILEGLTNTPNVPSFISRIVKPLRSGGGSTSTWWRAN